MEATGQLPAAVDALLEALLMKFSVSSWKITGQGDSGCEKPVVILRFEPTDSRESETAKNENIIVTGSWKKKSPSERNRDLRRLEMRRQNKLGSTENDKQQREERKQQHQQLQHQQGEETRQHDARKQEKNGDCVEAVKRNTTQTNNTDSIESEKLTLDTENCIEMRDSSAVSDSLDCHSAN